MNRRTFLHSIATAAALSNKVSWAKKFSDSTAVIKELPQGKRLLFCCKAENDLYRILSAKWQGLIRSDNAEGLIDRAPFGAGILLLADGYPQQRTSLTLAAVRAAEKKQLRVYVEYPAALPGIEVCAPHEVRWERTVVASGVFGQALPQLRILDMHECQFVPVHAAVTSHLVLARVVGFDTAIYGLPSTTFPLLFEHPGERILVATSKLSQFITGRYAPHEAWSVIWEVILTWLQPAARAVHLEWTATVRPHYKRTAALPGDALRRAIIRGIDWHTNARMLIGRSWKDEYAKYGNASAPIGPPPNPGWPAGDGEYGLLEGFNSKIFPNGGQDVRWWLRTDCNGESSLAFALRSKIDHDQHSETIARNLSDWVYFKSGLMHDDPTSADFGLLGWAPNKAGTFYQDNDVKAILGTIGTSAVLQSNRWDEVLLKNILGNFRTTGVNGFRGHFIDDTALKQSGWQYYWEHPTVDYSGHYESWIWAAYLWLYDKTHFAPLLERTKRGLRQMMAVYPAQWRWINGIQQDRGRMLLPLAWLIRIEDTPEHRGWLHVIAGDLLADQVECGAIRERMGAPGMSLLRVPASNEEYGTSEAPLIQCNGDPVADLLYTCNFALLGLHEATAATGDQKYEIAKEKLINFLLRVQIRSETHRELDGAWFRAFDFDRWDYWASNSDSGWGAWTIECGWTQGWINTGLALHYLKRNLWDMSKQSRIAEHMDKIRPLMLPDKVIDKT